MHGNGNPPWPPQGGHRSPYPPPSPYGPPPSPGGARLLHPIGAAQAVFRPSRTDRITDPAVVRVQYVRAWAGVAALVWVSVAYRLVAPEDLVTDRMFDVQVNLMVMACVYPVVAGGFALAALPPARGRYLLRSLRPIGAMLALSAAAGAFLLTVAPEAQEFRDQLLPDGPVRFALGLLVWAWAVPFMLYGAFLATAHVFRSADVHELMPPLLTTSLGWVMAGVHLYTGTYDGVPPQVAWPLIASAPLSVTAVALYEAGRLRRWHGVTLRGALGR